MNCANHADASAVAYCRTCGKALCANCTRPVRGVIYCEDCLGARMEAPAVPPGAAPSVNRAVAVSAPAPYPQPPQPPASGPNPTVAGILAGFFPFGVGAVYTGQYAKGLAHLAIAASLFGGAVAAGNRNNDGLTSICVLCLIFFYVYQIIDAVRSARAIQTAQPVPDPFGLAATFGGGASNGLKTEGSKAPLGAIVLILIGVLFLLNTMGLTEFGLHRFWPVILMLVGVWMFARNWGWAGFCCTGCQCARCRTRRVMGPSIVFTIGLLFLLENLNLPNLGFDHTWPILLLVIGGVKLLQNSASTEGHDATLASNSGSASSASSAGYAPPEPPIPPAPPVPPTSEVNRG